MAAEVDICNLALAYLGDAASVSSINPPDGSAQASHCARFYPIARDELLEMHTWSFTTTRTQLALAPTNPASTWKYAYQAPSNALNFLEVMDSQASAEYVASVQLPYTSFGVPIPNVGIGVPQPFQIETDGNGSIIILTDQQNAVLRYTATISDTTKFGPLATSALAWLLASKLAGPILKGDAGLQAAQACYAAFLKVYENAVESDSNDRLVTLAHGPAWMVNR